MQAVPEVVQGVDAENARHPEWVDILVAVAAVASEHNYNLQVPVVAVPVGATKKHVPSVPAFPQPT